MEKINHIRTTDQVQKHRQYFRMSVEEIAIALAEGKALYVVDTGMVNKHHHRLFLENGTVKVRVSSPWTDKKISLATVGGIRGYGCNRASFGVEIQHTICWEIGGGYV